MDMDNEYPLILLGELALENLLPASLCRKKRKKEKLLLL